MGSVSDAEFKAALPILQKLLWADAEDRAKLQSHGLTVAPSNFYSNSPSIEEINASFEYVQEGPPYLDSGIFDQKYLRAELESLIDFSDGFSPSVDGNEEKCTSYFWKNSQFSYSDAMSYFAFVRKYRPRSIVEFGSGFSSLVALEAISANGFGKLYCVEPFPRNFISNLGASGQLVLNQSVAQTVDPEFLNSVLQDGDILFIDSTHTVKSGSDCLHIYLRLLPKLKRKILVHAHDIFLPFGMPKKWLIDHQIYWTEQYLLLAFLTDNPRAKVLFGSAYHEAFNEVLLSRFMHGHYQPGGASFWFEYDGRD